jgi:methylenetetrahydrofolate--tRNA-(uracil-5-)-methyltransferase
MIPTVTILGAGLAGSEAAWQLAEAGVRVRLIDMKPERRTPAQVSDSCAELVCSNSLRSYNVQNAVGLIKEEMRRLGSLIIRTAITHRVPAGDALAVDRVAFSAAVTEALDGHPNITRTSAVAERLPDAQEGPCLVATGPLTASELAADIARATGAERLYFYDALAPIVSRDSLNERVVFAASRYGKGDGADYLNCPMNAEEYDRFLDALLAAECMPLHAFEEPKYFQGCLPVEVIAKSGRDALRYGPMKPVGLDDPRTGRWPHAVVQLRREDVGGQAFNLVGFQTKLKHPEQKRILRLIPGLETVEILRYGAIHRNTYLDSPALLDARMRLTRAPHLRFAGQITGVEGYVESAAHGLITALLLASDLAERPMAPPPPECALGALFDHVRGVHRLPGRPHEPQNVNWSMFPPPPAGVRKHAAKAYRVGRAQEAFEGWAAAHGLALASRAATPAQGATAVEVGTRASSNP